MMKGENRVGWFFTGLIIVIVVTLFSAIELQHPYFFFQDDNRVYFFPHIIHNVRAILDGELAFFNFHQYLGTASLASSEPAVLYPPYYLGYFLSQILTGDSYATMECIALFHLLLAAAGFYRLLRFYDLDPVSCLYGGIAWAFSGVVMVIGNSWLHYTAFAAFLPWVFLYAVRFCRSGRFADFLILSLLRAGVCLIGQPQFFAYMVVFEFLLAAGFLVFGDTTAAAGHPPLEPPEKPAGNRFATLSYYLFSFPVSLALAAPIILPTWHQVSISAKRSVPLEWDEYVGLSYDLILWFRGLILPLRQLPESTWTEQGFISHIGYPALLFLLLAWFKYRERRRQVLLLTAVALFALLWSGDTLVTRLIYYLPVYNKFRWPFKLAYFTSFFLIMVAAFGCSYCQSFFDNLKGGGRMLKILFAALVILLQGVNILVVYSASPQPMFSRHDDRVPFTEPLREMLTGGRIVSVGLVPPKEGATVIHGNSLPQLGFNYATLWGLQHFAGYEVLVAAENFQAALQLECRSVCNVRPKDIPLDISTLAPLDYFRKWGVRWYIVDSKLPIVPTDQLKLVYRDSFRKVLLDESAKPLVYWMDDNGEVSSRFETNSIKIKSDRQNESKLKINVLFNPYFTASIDGRITGLARTDDGQMIVTVPGGIHEVEIRYHDRDFSRGMLVSVGTLLGLIFYGCVLNRRKVIVMDNQVLF